MKAYFMSGKIYQNSPSGKIISGYFSTVASSGEKESVTFDEMFNAVLREYKIDSSQVHVEQFYKI